MNNYNNGLSEFSDVKNLLLKDLENLNNVVNSNTGHLGDIISGLKTITSSIDLKVERLKKEFSHQKKKQYGK